VNHTVVTNNYYRSNTVVVVVVVVVLRLVLSSSSNSNSFRQLGLLDLLLLLLLLQPFSNILRTNYEPLLVLQKDICVIYPNDRHYDTSVYLGFISTCTLYMCTSNSASASGSR